MNAYSVMGQSRIQQHDISAVLRTHGCRAGAFLAELEKQRGWQADAEMGWLLEQSGVTSESVASLLAMVRQAIGMALVSVGQHLVGDSHLGTSTEAAIAGALSESPARP